MIQKFLHLIACAFLEKIIILFLKFDGTPDLYILLINLNTLLMASCPTELNTFAGPIPTTFLGFNPSKLYRILALVLDPLFHPHQHLHDFLSFIISTSLYKQENCLFRLERSSSDLFLDPFIDLRYTG